MKNSGYFLFLLLLVSFSTVSAQYSYLHELNFYPRYARALRMGDTYTGIARGMEAVFYNPAGLAADNQFGVIYSNGHGIFESNELYPHDAAIAATLPRNMGTLGFSVEILTFDILPYNETQTIYSFTYARNITDYLALGFTLNTSTRMIKYSEDASKPASEYFGEAYDISLSALMKTPVFTTTGYKDELRIGVFMKNIQNTEMGFSFGYADPASQLLRAGFSYSFIPGMEKYHELSPLRFTIAGDAVFRGTEYEIYDWKPNFALEVSLYEILQLSFGRENRRDIKEMKGWSTDQFPVSRYGFGLTVPVSRLLKMNGNYYIDFNYCRSDWQMIDEDRKFQNGAGALTDAFSVSAGISY